MTYQTTPGGAALTDLADDDDRLSAYDRVLRFLRKRFDNFTFDPDKDPRFFLYLFEDFPGINIEEELKQFHAWTLDQDEMRPIYFRYHFRRWLNRRVRRQLNHYAKRGKTSC